MKKNIRFLVIGILTSVLSFSTIFIPLWSGRYGAPSPLSLLSHYYNENMLVVIASDIFFGFTLIAVILTSIATVLGFIGKPAKSFIVPGGTMALIAAFGLMFTGIIGGIFRYHNLIISPFGAIPTCASAILFLVWGRESYGETKLDKKQEGQYISQNPYMQNDYHSQPNPYIQPAPNTISNEDELFIQLSKLKKLKEEGFISEKEYEIKKQETINKYL